MSKVLLPPTGQGFNHTMVRLPGGNLNLYDVTSLQVASNNDTKNICIGKKGELFFLEDEKIAEEFKKLTRKKWVCISRPAFEILKSDDNFFLKRKVIVLTKKKGVYFPKCRVCHTPEDVLDTTKGEPIFVVGGPKINESFQPFVNKLIIIWVSGPIDGGDVFLSEIPQFFLNGIKNPIIHKTEDGRFWFSVVTYHKRRLLSR